MWIIIFMGNKEEEMFMVYGIEHTGIAAKDSKRLTDWYVKTFGCKIVYDNGKGTYFVAFESGDMIEIISAEKSSDENEEKRFASRKKDVSGYKN